MLQSGRREAGCPQEKSIPQEATQRNRIPHQVLCTRDYLPSSVTTEWYEKPGLALELFQGEQLRNPGTSFLDPCSLQPFWRHSGLDLNVDTIL